MAVDVLNLLSNRHLDRSFLHGSRTLPTDKHTGRRTDHAIPSVEISCRILCIECMRYGLITGSAVALHCCKAHSKSIGKMENSTPCKIVTPENFILKLGVRDYVENINHYTNFHVHRFSGGFSTNRWNITFLWLFSCPVLSFFSRTHAQLEPRVRYSCFMAQIS